MKKRLKGAVILLLSLLLAVILTLPNSETVQATALKLNKTNITLVKGKQFKLKVTGTKKKVKWSTDKKKVATVNNNGLVKAKSKGTARITAKTGKKKLICRVTVETPKLNKTQLTLNVGGTGKLKLSGTKGKVKWASTDPSVATVTKKGVVRGVRAGNCRIYAQVSGGSFLCVVTVGNSGSQYPNPIVTPTPTPQDQFNANDAKNSISYESHQINKGVVTIVKNNYRYAINLDLDCLYYNSYGTMVGKREDSCYALEPGREAALFTGNPYDSNYRDVEYSRYEIAIKCDKPYELGNAGNISCAGNFGDGNVLVTVRNNGKNVLFTKIAIVFYKNGNVIGYDYHYADVDTAGSTDYLQFNFPYDSEYNTIVPDNFRLYVNHSH